jgi:mRNA interferase RelE/StbE
MFDIIYANSISKDLRKISKGSLKKIKLSIEDLRNFPDITSIKSLKNHPLADYRLRIGDYRVLFDVNWEKQEINILKIGHRSKIYIKF